MRKTVLLAATLLVAWAVTAWAADEKTATLQNRWPFAAAKAVTANETYVFLGEGNIVRAYAKNNLARAADWTIATSEGITSMYYDAVSKYLVVTSGHEGLVRIDTANVGSTPAQHTITGESEPGILPRTRGVWVDGSRAFVSYTKIIPNSNALTGVEVVDISGGGDMTTLGANDIPQGFVVFTEARGIVLANNAVFVPDVINGLIGFIVDDTTPSAPQIDYSWILNLTGLDAAVSGNYIMVAGAGYGLQITNVTDPAKPVAVTFGTDTNGNPIYTYDYNGTVTFSTSIQVAGGVSYIADGNAGLQVIDVSTIDDPRLTGAFNTDITGAYSVGLDPSDAGVVYLADYESGLTKIDVSGAPALITSQNDTPANIDGLYMYLEERTTDAGNLFSYALDSRGPANREGLRILRFAATNNLTNTEYDDIQLEAFLPTPGSARDVYVTEIKDAGTENYAVYAFLADYNEGLRIYRVTTNQSGDKVVSLENDADRLEAAINQAQGVHTTDRTADDADITYVFVADGTNGLRAVNVSDKTAPFINGTCPADGSAGAMPAGAEAKDVIHAGFYAYVAAGSAGLQIVDVRPSAATYMEVVGSLDTPGDAKGVDILENYVFIAAGAGGVRIIDVTDPASPAETGFYTTTDATAIFVNFPTNDHGLNPDGIAYAYVADGAAGVVTLDVSSPNAPQKVTGWSYNTAGQSTDIAVNLPGSRVVVADGTAGLSILSLSDSTYDPDPDYPQTSIPEASSCFVDSLPGAR